MENLVNIFAENVARGNFVQIGPNFPAKSLDTLLIENTLLERILKQINALLNVTY